MDFPNGGDVLLVGNTVVQSRASRNPVVIAFGAEGNTWKDSRHAPGHNTPEERGPGTSLVSGLAQQFYIPAASRRDQQPTIRLGIFGAWHRWCLQRKCEQRSRIWQHG